MPLVGMDDLAEVTLTEDVAVTEVLTWETETDYAEALDTPGIVSDELADHSGGEADVAHSGYHVGSLTEGLVAYWPLDEGSGSTAVDATELGNDGTITGATYVGSGQVGGDALSFDGSDDIVDFSVTSSGLNSAYSISLWVRGDSLTTTGDGDTSVFSYVDFSGAGQGVVVGTQSGDGSFGVTHRDGSNNQQKAEESLGNFSNGVWYHIAVVWDGSDVIYYRDGTERDRVSSSSFSVPDNNTGAFGARDDDANYFPGDLDDVRFYDRALSVPEVEALANRTETSPVPTEATL